MAGKAAVAAAKSRGVEIINHGAGTMPVDAPAPYDGTRYTLLEDPADAAKPSMVAPHDGIKGADGRLHFADAPDFLPTLTPAECIRKGVFGGCYFNPKGGKPGIFGREVNVSHQEFPSAWFKDLPETLYLSRRYNVATNCYKVKSGFGQREWESKGWIHVQVPCACLSLLTLCPNELVLHSHASIRFTLDDVFSRVAVLFCIRQDPRGWFQWYCRFFCGRRSHDDERQIQRWAACASMRGRWRNQLCGAIAKASKHADDASVSPVIRQTLLHWAYELTNADFDEWKARKM